MDEKEKNGAALLFVFLLIRRFGKAGKKRSDKKNLTISCIAAFSAVIFMLTGCRVQESGNMQNAVDISAEEVSAEEAITPEQENADEMREMSEEQEVLEIDGTVEVSGGSAEMSGEIGFGMDAEEYAEKMGIGINLGNTMEAYWLDESRLTSGAQTIGNNTPSDYETCWGAVQTTKEMIDGIRDAGFSTVRIPVYWGNMMADDGTFTIHEDYIGRVKEIVDYCIEDELYVVINIHHYDEFLMKHYSEEDMPEIAQKLWTQIANYFMEYPDLLIFEGYNEALGMTGTEGSLSEDEMYAFVNEMNQTFVNAVRASGGNNASRLLIVSGFNTNIDATTDSRFCMPEDTAENRLMVSVHYIDNACYWSNSVGNAAWLDYSTEQCEALKERFLDQGIPVFIGECTSSYTPEHLAWDASITESSECLKTIVDMIGRYGMVPVLWDTCDQFYSRTEHRIVRESDRAVIEEWNAARESR